MANYAEAEYQKLKGLAEILVGLARRAQDERLLHDAEMAIKGNIGNPDALDNLSAI
jgi:hypothetical protein